MFTGLVQSLGTVGRVRDDGHGGCVLRVAEPTIAPSLALGESVAVNGACLTVVARDGGEFEFQAGPETLARTNLGRLGTGDRVNLERALRVGDALGGHFVTGHIDCVGKIAQIEPCGEWHTVWFSVPRDFDNLLVAKGSIAVDGVSLTVVDVVPERVSVMLIPHTFAATTLGVKSPGAEVNLEFDLIAKHVQKLFANLTIDLQPAVSMRPDEEIPILPAAGSEPVAAAPPPPPAAPVSHHPLPRQTLSYIRGLLQSHGLEPKSKLGQNFLIDLNLLDLICRTAELGDEDSVLEVGTGTGSLTALMADQAGCVFSVEVDKEIQRVARFIIGSRPNVHMFFGDALASKNELRAEMLAGWTELTARHYCTKRKLVANLPYVIATPVISNLLISDVPIERMVVMVQWEIAERMQAKPGTKDYNALSVLVQALADVETVRKVLPTNFFPKPKVDSAVVLIRPNPEKRAKVGDVKRLRIFLRDLYVHRRKNLRQALSGWPSGHKPKADVDAKLAELAIDGTVRSEALDVEQHLRLCAAFG